MVTDSERKTAYNSSVSVFRYIGEYMKTISQTYDPETAFNAQNEMCKRMGVQGAKMITQKPDRDEFTPQFALEYYVNGSRSTGIDVSGEVRDDKVLLTFGECPIYDGLHFAGFTSDMIKRFCMNNTLRTQLALEGFTGKARFEVVKFRDNQDDPCFKQVTFLT